MEIIGCYPKGKQFLWNKKIVFQYMNIEGVQKVGRGVNWAQTFFDPKLSGAIVSIFASLLAPTGALIVTVVYYIYI